MTTNVLDRDGFGLACEVIGRGSAVLLTHGFAASSHNTTHASSSH